MYKQKFCQKAALRKIAVKVYGAATAKHRTRIGRLHSGLSGPDVWCYDDANECMSVIPFICCPPP